MGRGFGFVLIIVSAAAFGAMPVFAQFAYQDGFNVASLLFYRFFLAFLVMLPVALVRKEQFPRGRDLAILMLMGGCGYVGQSFCYFTALTLIPAALVAILLYLYPVIVTLLSVFFLREKLTRQKLAALGLAVCGTFLVVGFKPGTDIKGILLGIGAALVYSVYILTGARVMRRNEVFPASVVIIGSAAAFYFFYSLKQGFCIPSNAFTWGNLLAISLVSTFLAIYTFFAGVKQAGAVNASLLSTFEPVTTVFLFLIIFHQPVGAWQAVGTLLVLGSAVLVATDKA